MVPPSTTSSTLGASFSSSLAYGGSARGAAWYKWDLHVHTPASIVHQYGDGQQDLVWEQYIEALAALPSEIKAIAINDYFSIEGYRRVLAAKVKGRLPNLELVLPAVELRLSHFAGQSELRKLNFHVVFSDELSPDVIEGFFLRSLNEELNLIDGAAPWRGCLGTREGLEDLGRTVIAATPAGKAARLSDLKAGFNSAAVRGETLERALNQSVFQGKALTALGLGEWAQMRLDGAGAAQKRDAVGRVQFVLTASPTTEQYEEQRAKLQQNEVNSRLFHASDAHYFADSKEPNRLGQTRCWIKADLTFNGLRRAIARFDERVWVGDVPPKLERIREHRTKYIRSIEIRRKPAAKLTEQWFNSKVELNPDLVALIGNQGGGKSALTDAIGLCGDSHVQGFSFLNPDRFCNHEKKASNFTATLTWEDGTDTPRSLDAQVDESSTERVRYVPQGFFDQVTNETAVGPGGRFYAEITKAVFSHVADDDRLGCDSFGALIETRTRATETLLNQLRRKIAELNRRILELETATSSAAVQQLTTLVESRRAELEDLRASPPESVDPPEMASADAEAVEQLRNQEKALEAIISGLRKDRSRLKKERTAVANATEALRTAAREANDAVTVIAQNLKDAGVSADITRSLVVTLDLSALKLAAESIEKRLAGTEERLDERVEGSDAAKVVSLREDREKRERAMADAAGAYQAYRSRYIAWEGRIADLEGDVREPAPESLRGLEAK